MGSLGLKYYWFLWELSFLKKKILENVEDFYFTVLFGMLSVRLTYLINQEEGEVVPPGFLRILRFVLLYPHISPLIPVILVQVCANYI